MISLTLHKSGKKETPTIFVNFSFVKQRVDVVTIILILSLYNQHGFRSYVLHNRETSNLKIGPVTTS